MKKAGFVIAFVLLIAATAASVFLFQKNQAGAQKLINAERSLKDVKQAFEERGRLLVDVKMSAEDAGKQAKIVGLDFERAMAELKTNRTTKAKISELVDSRDYYKKSLEVAQKQIVESHKKAEGATAKGQEDRGRSEKLSADLRSLGGQLKTANKKLKELEKTLNTTAAELDSQKQLTESKQAVIGEYVDLGVSPSEIRHLLKENKLLKGDVPSGLDPAVMPADTKAPEEKPPLSLNPLPFGLKLPLPAKRLTKPLRDKYYPGTGKP